MCFIVLDVVYFNPRHSTLSPSSHIISSSGLEMSKPVHIHMENNSNNIQKIVNYGYFWRGCLGGGL